jgi:hemerythrin-like domain-containing protein
MSDAVITTRPDTSDMIRVHRVFRQAFAVAPHLLGSVAADDVEQVRRITTFYTGVLLMVRFHHEGEDALLWPRLRERCADGLAAVSHAAGQHDRLHDGLQGAEQQLTRWSACPTLDGAASLAGALAELAADLTVHLDDEERTILPLIEEHLTAEEWHQLPAHGVEQWRRHAPELRWLAVGLLREQQDPELRASLNAAMAAPVREWWLNEGQPMFDQFIIDLRR